MEALDQLQVIEPIIALSLLETVLAAEGWGAAMREGDIAAQREVLAAIIEQVVPVRTARGKNDVDVTWTTLGEAMLSDAGGRGLPRRLPQRFLWRCRDRPGSG